MGRRRGTQIESDSMTFGDHKCSQHGLCRLHQRGSVQTTNVLSIFMHSTNAFSMSMSMTVPLQIMPHLGSAKLKSCHPCPLGAIPLGQQRGLVEVQGGDPTT